MHHSLLAFLISFQSHARDCRISGQDEMQACQVGSASIIDDTGFIISSCYPIEVTLESYKNLASVGGCSPVECVLDTASCGKRAKQVTDKVTGRALSGCAPEATTRAIMDKFIFANICSEK